ncbi:hypothetical protein [Paenibacillus apiarius]|uniref:Uncharacterized protein n=1 Tax=Paenibacillus apiarius TaxID=46240 RepID=A0ABT4DXU4_9BACL|nr:hypothetical protein [Paenibacillus apiarius]MCY9517563.1 hypothetical protein [Paenibacillus apiarius]MCY9522158.1 hypothetical protein [Paenibacillus apiarius]MCY9552192.1 hypothetical protein [Paenibacillus apiarius]MCY9560071.1 hypothetical protein [Paenibacillus apiarius]MCY9683689.1 hypothetical protein [Paenibacillus apiarius]
MMNKTEERLRYELSFFDCRNIQVSLALQDWGVPVELLYYNAWESTSDIYEHLYVKKSMPWSYVSPCLEPAELELVGVPFDLVPYTCYDDIAPLLKETDYAARAVFLWIACGEVPYAKPGVFGTPEAEHSIWIRGWAAEERPGIPAGYCVRDTYPEYEGMVSEEDIRRMCEVPHIKEEDRKAFILWKQEQAEPADAKRIMERYADRNSVLEDDLSFYDEVCAYAESGGPGPFADLTELYDCHAHAFKFIAGSRYVFSAFVEAVEGASERSRLLRDIARKADTLKNVFLMAVHSGRADAKAIIRMCRALQQLEYKWKSSGDIELCRNVFAIKR